MSSKLPPLTPALIPSLLAEHFNTTNPNQPPSAKPLIASLSLYEPKAAIQTIDPQSSPSLSTYYATYLLALILDSDLPEARHLSNRIDPNLLQDPLIASAVRVLQAVWSNDYVVFHETIQGGQWGDVVSGIAGEVLQQHRTKTLRLLSGAYTSIPPSLAQKYLGIADEERTVKMLVEENRELGWSYEASKGVLVRDGTLPIPVGAGTGANVNGKGDIARLAGLAGHLSDL